MNIQKQSGMSLFGMIVVMAFSAFALSVLYANYKEVQYNKEAIVIQNGILRLRDNIKEFMMHEENCSKLNNKFVIENGLLPGVFKLKNSRPNIVTTDSIIFKYGTIDVGVVTLGGLPASITSADTFTITLSNYDFHKVPLMLEPLVNEFDRIRWYSNNIVATQGDTEGLWDFYVNYWGSAFDGQTGADGDAQKSKIGFEMWDC